MGVIGGCSEKTGLSRCSMPGAPASSWPGRLLDSFSKKGLKILIFAIQNISRLNFDYHVQVCLFHLPL